MLYCDEKLPITNLQTYDDQTCEALICTCELSKMIICVLYRPPGTSDTSFKSCIDFISKYIGPDNDGYELILLGDFNLPLIDWKDRSLLPCGSTISAQNCAQLLLDFMSEHMCTQFITEPTRESNILDLFICNSGELVTHISVSDTELSDHRFIEIHISHNPSNSILSTPPDFTSSAFHSLDFFKADYERMNTLFSSIDWIMLWDISSPDLFPELFTQTLLQICEMCCPKKTAAKSKKNSRISTISRKKRKLQAKLRAVEYNPHTPVTQIEALKRKIALIHIEIRDAYNESMLHREHQAVNKLKENPKYFYSYAKQFSKKRRNISMLFDENNNICSNPKDIANILQRQFTSVFSDPSKTDIPSALFDSPAIDHQFNDEMLEFTISDIIEAIQDIKPNAAAGPDEIPVCLLKKCKETLAVPIHILWSYSMTIGKVPDFYKSSYISPLHKKDSRALPGNYRPISLTSHIIKIYERVLRKKLVEYLESNNLLCSNQHGFRSGRSCLTQLLHHFDDVMESISNNCDFDSIYLDYAKAFDKVDHQLLISKLNIYGIHPKLITWIESFLTDRTQAVVVDGHLSLHAIILSGVPQGTVLGPILFLLHINDIALCVTDSILRCLADDTRISRSIGSAYDVILLQKDLEKVIQWSENNNMTLHKDKFEYICHRYNKMNDLSELPFISEYFQYTVSSEISLSPVHQLRDLGVIVSSNLSWSPHIKVITDKARQKAAWVLSVFHTRSKDVMLTLYKSMVRSLLEYCCPLWNPAKICDIQELESVQKVFTSKISGMNELHYWERLHQLSLMSLQRRRERYIILHMWKILHNRTSNDVQVIFDYRPRLGNQAKIPNISRNSTAANQTLYDCSFAVMGPRLWNCIPYNLNTISCLDTFKNKLTRFLLAVPDKPPIRGYTSPNSNSLLCWRNNRDACALWGGGKML